MVGSVVVWMWTVGVGCFLKKNNQKEVDICAKKQDSKVQTYLDLKKLEKKLEKKYLSI
jgi:hypothetical protein